jgi:hypothetical protein
VTPLNLGIIALRGHLVIAALLIIINAIQLGAH